MALFCTDCVESNADDDFEGMRMEVSRNLEGRVSTES